MLSLAKIIEIHDTEYARMVQYGEKAAELSSLLAVADAVVADARLKVAA